MKTKITEAPKKYLVRIQGAGHAYLSQEYYSSIEEFISMNSSNFPGRKLSLAKGFPEILTEKVVDKLQKIV